VRSYTHTVQRIQLNDRVRLLVAKKHKEMQQKITEGLHLQWDDVRLEKYSHELSVLSTEFVDKVEEAISIGDSVNKVE
jgi:hypothetical protein